MVPLSQLLERHIAAATTAAIVGGYLLSNVAYFMAGSWLLRDDDSRAFGFWLLAVGFVSTLFHTVQAVGCVILAEALCFVDHGLALTVVAYYWEHCGRPSSRATLGLGATALTALAWPASHNSGLTGVFRYVTLHSLWHALSAGAAVAWVRQRNDSGSMVQPLSESGDLAAHI